MKKSLLIAALLALPLSTSLAWADEAHHSDKDKMPVTTMTDKDKHMQMMQGMMRGGMMGKGEMGSGAKDDMMDGGMNGM